MIDHITSQLKKSGKYWIVFSGDSITSCEWVHPNWRDIVIYVLHEEFTRKLDGDWKTVEWGIRGFNFAYDGATTKDIYQRIDQLLILNPQLVISLMGGNDPAMGVSVSESVANITHITNQVISAGTTMVWSNSTPAGQGSKKNVQYQPYAQAFMDMPDQTGLIKIDMFNLYQQFPTDKFFTFVSEANPIEGIKAGEIDLQHPNQLGNAYIAKVILKHVFDLDFHPEKYIQDTLAGLKFPQY